MVFSMGNKVLPDIIDDIANGLIATTGGYWTDTDILWNTLTRTTGFDNARRALKYINGAETIYLALESINASKMPAVWDSNYRRKGLRVTFSSAWDYVTHTPSGTKQQSFVMFEGKHYPYVIASLDVKADLATLRINYYLWTESNGFALMGRPEPVFEDDYQSSFIVVVERGPIKEYSDGYTNFYCYNRINYVEINSPRNNPAYDGLRLESMMRPFAYISCARKDYYQDPNTSYADNYQYLQRAWDTTYQGYNYDPRGITFPLLAYRSIVGGKVYYAKPLISNSITVQGSKQNMEFDPIFSSELFFPFREDGGITDGDIIAIEGKTTMYLCKSLDSADMTTRLNYAIKYIA